MVLQVCCCGRVAAEENGCACGSIPSWLSAAAQRAMEAPVVTSTITVLEGPAGIRPCGLARLPGAFASGSASCAGIAAPELSRADSRAACAAIGIPPAATPQAR